jgi:hypothetical protein
MADGGTLTDLGVLLPGQEARNGYYTPANSPGHGLVFDRDKLAANTVARVAATDALMAVARLSSWGACCGSELVKVNEAGVS